jgi:ribosomal protein S18 acetylase RimI-like enzyme
MVALLHGIPQEHHVNIRAATLHDAEPIARVHIESWRTTYKGIVPDDFLAPLSYAQREQFWYQMLTDPGSRTVVYIAEGESGQVVGFASGGPERRGDPVYTGELYAIYLLAPHQGHGIGRQLAITLVIRLMQDGLTALLVLGPRGFDE